MLSREKRLCVEKLSVDLYISRSDNFDNISEFTKPRYQREVRIMTLRRLISVSESREQKGFIFHQSLKYDCVDLHFEALSSLLDILTDPLEVASYFLRRYDNDIRFENLRVLSLTKSLKRIIDNLELGMIANYLRVPNTDNDYKKMLNDRIIVLIPNADLDDLLSIINKPNVFDEVNLLVWPEIIKAVSNVPVSRILEIIKSDRLHTLQAYDLLRVICSEVNEISILEAHKVFLIASNRHFDELKTIAFDRIEYLLPITDVETIAKLCKATINGTRLNKIVIAALKSAMLTASPEVINAIYHQSIGSKDFNELMSQIVQRNSSDIKVWSL